MPDRNESATLHAARLAALQQNAKLLRPFTPLAHLFHMAGFADIEIEPETAHRLALGDVGAQSEVYRCASAAVMGLAVRMLQDRHAAQEVVQDTFVQLIEHGSDVREPRALVGWIRKVAVNLCLMRLRSPWHARRQPSPAEHITGGGVDLWDRDDDAASSTSMEATPDIEQALARLTPQTRAVVWLHDVEGYTHREIGDLLGKTASFSKSQLSRGYEKLALWYQPSTAGSVDGGQPGHVDGKKDDPETNNIRPACSP
ncbi:MAG: RNA polymerase sigma factor [Pseudomonadales bacterium]